MKELYEKHFQNWLEGLSDEIGFWDSHMRSEGGCYFYLFADTVSANKKFILENEIPEQFYGKDYRFLDVGSGPFSRCGRITDKVHLKAEFVDPLADVYEKLKVTYQLQNGNVVETGFVEWLNKKFPSNSFDMVHMSNSLDHCFDAIDGLKQLLNVCKIGGKVILRHAENEAENENYKGLHQWNLSLHNPENSFIIWRANERYDICKIFEEYADVYLYPDVLGEDEWIYNKVVMVKKKELCVSSSDYYDLAMSSIYRFLLETLLDFTKNKPLETKLGKTEFWCKKIRDAYYDSEKLEDRLKQKKINNVAVYGMGLIGKNLCYLIKKCGIDVKYMLDQKGVACGNPNIYKLEECKEIHCDAVIITVLNDFEDIREMFINKGFDEKCILSLAELLPD